MYITSNNKIKKVSLTGKVTSVAGGDEGYADGTKELALFKFRCTFNSGLTFFNNKLYVSDTCNNKIRVIE